MQTQKTSEKSKNGFTLLELLVVISIIGMLASMVLVSMGGSRGKARDSRRITDLRQIPVAQESVINDSGVYQTSGLVVGSLPAIKNSIGFQYLAPAQDPLNDADYQYIWVKNDEACGSLLEGTFYCALAKMETKSGCAANEYRYFVVHNFGQKERCDTIDYVANPSALNCSTCLLF